MSKIFYTHDELEILRKCPHVKSVSEKSIQYTNEFIEYVVRSKKEGVLTRDIFTLCGLEILT